MLIVLRDLVCVPHHFTIKFKTMNNHGGEPTGEYPKEDITSTNEDPQDKNICEGCS